MNIVVKQVLDVLLRDYRRQLLGGNVDEKEMAAAMLTQAAENGVEGFLLACDKAYGDRYYLTVNYAMDAVAAKLKEQYYAIKNHTYDDETCARTLNEAQQITNGLKEMFDIQRRLTGTPAYREHGAFMTAMTFTRLMSQELDSDPRLSPEAMRLAHPPYGRDRDRDEKIYQACVVEKRSRKSVAQELGITSTRVDQLLKRILAEREKAAEAQ